MMADQVAGILEARLLVLENRNRVFERIATCCIVGFPLLAVSAGFLYSAGASASVARVSMKVVETEKILLKDGTGKTLASLDVWDESVADPRSPSGRAIGPRPRFVLYDQSGKERLELTVGADGAPSVLLNGPEQTHRVRLLVDSIGSAHLDMYTDIHLVSLTADAQGGAELRVGEATLHSGPVGIPSLLLKRGATWRVLLGGIYPPPKTPTADSERPVFVMSDEAGQTTFKAP